MKITRKQLTRLIRKEHARMMKESITDMASVDDVVQNSAFSVADEFAGQMETLFHEDPEMFQGRSTLEEWQDQVLAATAELESQLSAVIAEMVEEVEMKLHDGQYHSPRRSGGRGNRPR